MRFFYTLLATLFIFGSLIGCGERTGDSSKDKIEQPTPSNSKNAKDIFTAGDDQTLLVGEEVTIGSLVIDKSKNFKKITWSEDGKFLGDEEVLHASNLPTGKHEITLKMEDSDGVVYTDIVVVYIKEKDEKNHRPTADSFTLKLDEDSKIMTHLRGGDEDGDPLSYLSVSYPKHGKLTGSTAHLVYTPDPNYNGKDSFTFKTNDGKIDSKYATIDITIDPINDAPIFETAPISEVVKVDKNLSLEIVVSDIDGDDLEFTTTPSWIVYDGKKVDINPTKDITGIQHVTIKANDRDKQEATFEFDINLIKKLTIIPIDPILLSEDNQTYIGEFRVEGEDNSDVKYTITNAPKGFLHKDGNFSLDLSSYQYLKEDENITFTATLQAEVENSKDSIDFNITILGKNDTPKFGSSGYPDATQDKPYRINLREVLNITDIDDDNLTIKASIIPSWLKVKDGIAEGTPTNADIQNHNLLRTDVNDGHLEFDSTFAASIKIINVNDAPIAIIHKDKNITNQYANITFDASQSYDIDRGDKIESYIWLIDNNQTYTDKSFTTSFNKTGEHNITLSVGDKNNSVTTTTSIIDIKAIKPQFKLKNLKLSEDDSTVKTIIASQTRDYKYEVINQSKPMWFNLSTTGVFTIDTKAQRFQPYQEGKEYNKAITIRATDKFSNQHTDKDFILTIIGKNDAPIAINDTINTDEDAGPIELNILKNDTDIDNNRSDLKINKLYSENLNLSISNNKVLFTPQNLKHNENKTYTFSYDIKDKFDSLSNKAIVTINVKGKEDKPSATITMQDPIFTTNPTIIKATIQNPDNYKITNSWGISPDNNYTINRSSSDELNITFSKAGSYSIAFSMQQQGKDHRINIIKDLFVSANVSLFPKTGDKDDGGFGADRSFSRDDSTNIVTDLVTKLMWQDDVKIENQNEMNLKEANQTCQNLTLGGYGDWRVPNRLELYMLSPKVKDDNGIYIDNIFKHIGETTHYSFKTYWANSTDKRYLNFYNSTDAKSINYSNYVRCVRGDEITVTLEDNNNTVLDKKHNLMWDNFDHALKDSSSQEEAKTYCKNLIVKDYSDWRLPNVYELYSITSENGILAPFDSYATKVYLSSTKIDNKTVYKVKMGDGLDHTIGENGYIRCVRSIN
jgi:VCBS repeat-containing protein